MSNTNTHKHKDKKKDKHKSKGATMAGTLDITRSGMGYVILKESDTKDILVRPQDMSTALDGDLVEIKITKMSPMSDRREGRVTKVIQRKQTEFMGTLSVSDNYAFFIAAGEKPMPDIYIPRGKFKNLPDNSKVIARLVEWSNKEKKPVGEVISVVTPENENDFAMKGLLNNSGFTVGFSDEVLQASNQLPETISEEEISRRKDFRETLTFTVDPADAKDFDDAISIRKIDRSWYEVGIHIADVSHYVTPGTELDKEAYKRATSVYLPDRVNPMLPEHISNVLCSLRPNEDKLTFSAVFSINSKGEVKDPWIGRSVIHSDHRFAYEDAQEIIDGAKGPHQKEVLWLHKMTQVLRKERFSKGAINFSSQEVRFKLDEHGKPIGIEIKESKPSHQMIEELMLLANKNVARFIADKEVKGKPIPFPYRVHDQPDEDKFASFVPFAKKYGYQFDLSSPQKIAESFNSMLQKAQGQPEQHLLEQLGIRTMAKAIYTTENIGHYGLGFEDYCHFTSPIRRYPDVMVHRIVASVLEGQAIIDKKMEEKCKHCSDRERAAMECERAGNKYKQVEYMRGFLGDEFDGVVSGVAEFGFWVETVNEKCEGLVSIHSLSEPYNFVPTEYMLEGEVSHKRIQMGKKVKIQVVAANLEKRQLDYLLITDGVAENNNSGHQHKSQRGGAGAGSGSRQGAGRHSSKGQKKDRNKGSSEGKQRQQGPRRHSQSPNANTQATNEFQDGQQPQQASQQANGTAATKGNAPKRSGQKNRKHAGGEKEATSRSPKKTRSVGQKKEK